MRTELKSLEEAVVTCERLMQKIQLIESQVKDLEDQKEHNASCGNWSVVKATKDAITRLNRDKGIIAKLLEEAEER